MKLTRNQQMIVDIEGRDTLVSAAAGSGKTATMVETVTDKVVSGDNPIDIDEVLMVTFSNLAANQMKEKIRRKFESLLEKTPENEHLARQLVLVNRADISTIDKFCKKLVSENYERLGIDSNFEIIESGMASSLQNEVLDKIFYEEYEKLAQETKTSGRYADFAELRSFFCKNNNDDKELKKAVVDLYTIAMKQVYPKRWLKQAIANTNIKTEREFEKLEFVNKLLEHQRNINNDFIPVVRGLLPNLQPGENAGFFEDIINKDIDKIININSELTYQGMHTASKSKWATVAKKAAAANGISEELLQNFCGKRDKFKDLFGKSFSCKIPMDKILMEYAMYRKFYIPFILLTIKFMDQYQELKKKRRMFEFSDISHMAYNLVCEKRFDGKIVPTDIAKSISENYKYIFIDEYQDGDFVQEGILTAISLHHKGEYNMYMIGDVKQSIYGFRNARPEIFMDKYYRYDECVDVAALNESVKEAKILLNENFRSRCNVLNSTNFVFWQLMDKSLGGLDYGKYTMLVEGCKHPDSPSNLDTEILLVNHYDEETEEESSYTKEDLEVALIMKQIKSTLNSEDPYMVLKDDYQDILDKNPDMSEEDKKNTLYRPARPGDIAVLMRSTKGTGEKLYNALIASGIPVQMDATQGYYEATELRVVMSMLDIIDNRYQDIPLSAVLLSPIVNINENELALIVKYGMVDVEERISLYEKCTEFLKLFDISEDVQNCALVEEVKTSKKIKDILIGTALKLKKFMLWYEELKKKAAGVSISDLIWMIVNESMYYEYAGAMPGGARRKANLDKLMDIAHSYEKGTYKSLFDFVQYVKRFEIDDIDVGEANASESLDAITIMTMHKSKGLEYPIVFASRLCVGFPSNEKSVLRYDNEYFVYSKAIDDNERIRFDGELNTAISALKNMNRNEEEMRLLYVAMTRAKEKLYLTGSANKTYINNIDKLCANMDLNSMRLPYSIRYSNYGYMAWIEACYRRFMMYEDGQTFGANVTDADGKDMFNIGGSCIRKTVYNYAEIEKYIQKTAEEKTIDFAKIIAESKLLSDESLYNQIKKEIGYEYMYDEYTRVSAKYSISDIKKLKAYEETEDSDKLYNNNSSQSHISGSERGSIIHKYMELVPFEELEEGLSDKEYRNFVKKYKDMFLKENIFNQDETNVIPEKHIAIFFASSLGQRMIAAAKRRELFKEKGFTKAFPVLDIVQGICDEEDRIKLEKNVTDDVILVQGIIDAFFYENGKVVLMDYKTDRLSEENLVNKYHAQLEYYAQTIEELLGMKVDERLIYSFHNDDIVVCNVVN